ncbi:hypothetical protein RND71_008274 [Anisodus tanguticus]|uniref:Uncharacterized protein n=1 Tax=Anisodus tanguticus TaxID=243964 RepID=A0AAE1SNF3_9SOLA|nr:hypothetical protein RND71_008274 [Anisodus tanguticus]
MVQTHAAGLQFDFKFSSFAIQLCPGDNIHTILPSPKDDLIVKVPYDATVQLMLASLERNLLPDAVIRRLTRLLLAARLHSGYKLSAELQLSDLLQFVHCMFALFSNFSAQDFVIFITVWFYGKVHVFWSL